MVKKRIILFLLSIFKKRDNYIPGLKNLKTNKQKNSLNKEAKETYTLVAKGSLVRFKGKKLGIYVQG